ncbi:hypothetical protein M408DRAFT_329717, partial [Serendipita vermifera MAFF 305830]
LDILRVPLTINHALLGIGADGFEVCLSVDGEASHWISQRASPRIHCPGLAYRIEL